MILYINCCVRAESRTDRLARAALRRLMANRELPILTKDKELLGLFRKKQ